MIGTPRPPPLFVGDHLALDFLNSRAMGDTEWLRDGADLVAWLEAAGAIDRPEAARFAARGSARALAGVAAQARDLREWLRGFVARHAGAPLGASAAAELAPLNRLLAADDSYLEIVAARDDDRQAPQARRVRRWQSPADLLQPVAAAIADLVCYTDFRLIRTCEGAGCTLTFLDRTKSHARRWCSMALCGNRAKVAAHRARARRRSGETLS